MVAITEKPLSIIWKGVGKKILIIGEGCRKDIFSHYATATGAHVTIWDERNLKNYIVDENYVRYQLVMIADPLNSNLKELCEHFKYRDIPLFVYGRYDLSDVWIDDCARELPCEYKNCSLHLNEGYISTSEDNFDSNSSHTLEVVSLESSIQLNNEHRQNNSRGSISLVGAGPGDPELLTLSAINLIQTADVILADKLIPESILCLANGQIKIATKHAGNAEIAQNELNQWGAEALKNGYSVVRLKGGDPFMFGRGGEEVRFYRQLGYEPKVVPGLSSLISGPLLAGIPITLRGTADQVLVATGRRRDGAVPDLPIYSPTRTLVLAMALHRINQVVEDLFTLKYPSSLPISIISRASYHDQRSYSTVLDQIGNLVQKTEILAPALIVIGHAVDALKLL